MKKLEDLENVKPAKEYPPYKCKMCGQGIIENSQEICAVCGWQDCRLLSENPDCFGGPSLLTYNQYKQVWEDNKEKISTLKYGKASLVKKLFEASPNTYGNYSKEQLELINKGKNE
jgi:hypothetical protein